MAPVIVAVLLLLLFIVLLLLSLVHQSPLAHISSPPRTTFHLPDSCAAQEALA